MLKKAVPFLIIGSIITAMVMFIVLKSESEIEGHVYSITGTDTLYLSDVDVYLTIVDQVSAGDRAPDFNAEYHQVTDAKGYFKITIKIVPYSSNYKYVFIKDLYVTKVIKETVRFSADKQMHVELSAGNAGDFDFNPHIEYVGSVDEYDRVLQDRYSNALMVFLLLGIVAVFLIWRYFPFILVIDWFRNITNRGFKGLKKSKKEALLKEGFCDSCKDYMGMTFEREEIELGMTFIHGTCDKCGGPIKVRMN